MNSLHEAFKKEFIRKTNSTFDKKNNVFKLTHKTYGLFYIEFDMAFKMWIDGKEDILIYEAKKILGEIPE